MLVDGASWLISAYARNQRSTEAREAACRHPSTLTFSACAFRDPVRSGQRRPRPPRMLGSPELSAAARGVITETPRFTEFFTRTARLVSMQPEDPEVFSVSWSLRRGRSGWDRSAAGVPGLAVPCWPTPASRPGHGASRSPQRGHVGCKQNLRDGQDLGVEYKGTPLRGGRAPLTWGLVLCLRSTVRWSAFDLGEPGTIEFAAERALADEARSQKARTPAKGRALFLLIAPT